MISKFLVILLVIPFCVVCNATQNNEVDNMSSVSNEMTPTQAFEAPLTQSKLNRKEKWLRQLLQNVKEDRRTALENQLDSMLGEEGKTQQWINGQWDQWFQGKIGPENRQIIRKKIVELLGQRGEEERKEAEKRIEAEAEQWKEKKLNKWYQDKVEELNEEGKAIVTNVLEGILGDSLTQELEVQDKWMNKQWAKRFQRKLSKLEKENVQTFEKAVELISQAQ